MKRLMLIIVLVVLMIVPLTSVQAINLNNEGPYILADLMPDSTEVFVASRVGADFITEVDAIITGVSSKLPDSLATEPYTFDNIFRQAFAKEGQDWDQLIGLVGKYAAIGLEPVGDFDSGENPLVIFIVEITNQEETNQFFLDSIKNPDRIPERQMDGDTILYVDESEPLKALITPTHFILTNNMDYSPNVDAPLSASADFTSALSMLSADNYNSLAYFSEAIVEALLNSGDTKDLQNIGLNSEDAGAIVIGSTILAGNTFALDIAIQTIAPMPTSIVTIDFLKAMPSSTDTFIVATDLTNAYNSIVEGIRSAARANDEQDPTAQIPLLFNFTGLDLEEDVLSWTTGGYGIFFGADFIALLEEVMTTDTVSELNFDAGIVIEATDVTLAQNAATELGSFISMTLASEESVTVTQDGNMTSIIVELPIDPSMPPLELEFVLTATDQFFFFGTRSALDKILSGDTLAKNADFAKSTQYFLENPSSVWYTNSDGVIVSTVIPLTLVGPAIGNVFENVVEELGGDPSTTTSSPSNTLSDEEQILEVFKAYDDMFRSMSLTTSIDANGVVRLRGTLSVNP